MHHTDDQHATAVVSRSRHVRLTDPPRDTGVEPGHDRGRPPPARTRRGIARAPPTAPAPAAACCRPMAQRPAGGNEAAPSRRTSAAGCLNAPSCPIRKIRDQLRPRLMEVRFVHDAVAIEDRPRLVPRQLHRDALGHPCTHQVPRRRPPAVMEEPTGHARFPTRRRPGAAPRPHRRLVSGEDTGVPSAARGASPVGVTTPPRSAARSGARGPRAFSTARARAAPPHPARPPRPTRDRESPASASLSSTQSPIHPDTAPVSTAAPPCTRRAQKKPWRGPFSSSRSGNSGRVSS